MAQIHFDITADASNLVSTVNKATGQMREFASMMKDIGAQGGAAFDTPAKQIKALEDAIKSNERVMEEYKKKIEELAQKQREAALAGDTKMVNALGEDMNTLAKQMAETSKETDVLRGGLESMTGTSGNAGKATGALGKNIKGLDDVARILPGPLRGIATGISNVVKAAKALIATPVGLVLAGLSAALAGVSAWLKNSDQGLYITVKMSDKLQSLSEKVLNTSKRMKALEEATRTGATKSVSEFMKLQSQWNKAKESGEGLNKVYPKIRKELSSLGVSVNSVAQAESVLVQNAGAVIQSFIQKAKAAALYKKAEEEVAQALDLEQRTNKKNTRRQNRADRWRRNTENVAAFFDKALPEDATNFAKNSNAFFSNAIRAWGQYHGDLLEARISDANTRVQNLYEKAAETFNEGTDFEKEGQDILKGLKAYTDSDYNDYLKRVQNFKTLLEKSKREMEQRAKEIEFDRRAAEINALDEGSEKVRAQMKLNYDRELASIDEWYEGLRDEKIQKEKELFEANPANAGKAFTYDRNSARYAPTASETALYGAKRASASAEYLRGLKEQYDKEIQEFGSFEEKRAQIVEKWEKKIAGIRNASRRAEAERQRDEEIAGLEKQYSDVYGRIYADMDGMSAEIIRSTIDLAENELAQLAATGRVTSEEFRNLRDRIEELKVLEQNTKYKSYGTSFLDVFQARDRANILGGRYLRAASARDSYYQQHKSVLDLGVDPKMSATASKLFKEYQKLVRAAKEASDAFDSANQDLEKTSAIATGILAGQVFEQLGTAMSKFGIEAGKTISEVANLATSVLSQIATGNVPGAVISGAAGVFSMIIDGFSEAEARARELEAANINVARSLQLIELSINNEKFSTIFGTDERGGAQEALAKARAAREAYEQRLQQAMNYGQSFGSGKRGGTEIPGNSAFNIETSILYVNSIIEALKKNGEYTEEAIQVVIDGMAHLSEEEKAQIQHFFDLKKAEDEALEAAQSYVATLTDHALEDAASQMVDNFFEIGKATADMSENADDFARNLAKGIVKAALMKQVFADFNTDDFIKKLMSDDEELQAQAVQDYEELMGRLSSFDATGILQKLGLDRLVGDATQQSSAGGFQTMSQDTANELNGRFTALQINSEILVQNSIQGVSLLQVGNTTLLEIRNFHLQEVGYLEDIAKQTKPLLDFGEKLDQIQRNTANLR